MNKMLKTLLLSFMLTVFFCGCSPEFWHPGEERDISSHTFTSIPAFETWLTDQPANTVGTAYNVKLNTNNLEGMGDVLADASNKYVYLDLSGSFITTIPSYVFNHVEYEYVDGDSGAVLGIVYSICDTLTGINIPNSVTSIEEAAFASCENLASINIPNSVTSIGGWAFIGCSSLSSITIPNSVTSIGDWAFEGCASLTAINIGSGNSAYSSENGVLFNKNKTTLIKYPARKTATFFIIPNSVTSIGSSAFYDCSSLANINIPDSVTSIEFYAFYNCSSLVSVTIPDSVTSIDDGAFEGCASLTAINVGSGNNTYSSENGVLFNKNKTILINYPVGKTATSFTIPNGVTIIRENAFGRYTSLASVTIPYSITSIRQWAFVINTLVSVTFQGTIFSSEFSIGAFIGDLRAKFYATDSANGTPGTYTRASGSNTWTRQ